jgi:hypothetical protein
MEKPTKPRMPNLLIVGEPNNGKTTLIRRFVDLHGQGYVNEDAEPVKPLLPCVAHILLVGPLLAAAIDVVVVFLSICVHD